VNKAARRLFTGHTLLIVIGAGVLIPRFPNPDDPYPQVINGVLLLIVLIFMVLLVNKRDLMKNWVNWAVTWFLGHGGGDDRHDASPSASACAILTEIKKYD
jgi:Mn2+/Fe2+ NRAMP family transporter